MPKVSAQCHELADPLLDFLGLGEPTLLVPRPQGLPVDADFKDAAGQPLRGRKVVAKINEFMTVGEASKYLGASPTSLRR